MKVIQLLVVLSLLVACTLASQAPKRAQGLRKLTAKSGASKDSEQGFFNAARAGCMVPSKATSSQLAFIDPSAKLNALCQAISMNDYSCATKILKLYGTAHKDFLNVPCDSNEDTWPFDFLDAQFSKVNSKREAFTTFRNALWAAGARNKVVVREAVSTAKKPSLEQQLKQGKKNLKKVASQHKRDRSAPRLPQKPKSMARQLQDKKKDLKKTQTNDRSGALRAYKNEKHAKITRGGQSMLGM